MIFNGPGYSGSFDPGRFMSSVNGGLKRGLVRGAILLTNTVKQLLSVPGPMWEEDTGKPWKKKGIPMGILRHSRPGEPPRKITGLLRSSIDYAPRNNGFIQRVGSPLRYARELEWGAAGVHWRVKVRRPNAVKDIVFNLAPRPFLRPALRMTGRRIYQFCVDEVRKAARGTG